MLKTVAIAGLLSLTGIQGALALNMPTFNDIVPPVLMPLPDDSMVTPRASTRGA